MVNNMIRVNRVRLIDENGENLGDLDTEKAKQIAEEKEMDLVMVNPKANPPICKIANYGKLKYEKEKLDHKKKLANKKTEIKGIRLSFKIKGNDLETKIKQAKKFLESGNNVKIDLVLKGREKAHADNAKDLIQEFINGLDTDNIKIIQDIQKQGGKYSAIVAPKK